MREERFILLGDAVWLDFVNTARGREPNPPDRLPALARMGRMAGRPAASPGHGTVRRRPRPADAPHRPRRALATSQPSPSASVRAINALLASVPGGQQLVRVAGQWQLTFAPDRASRACCRRSRAWRPRALALPTADDPHLRRANLLTLPAGSIADAVPPLVQPGPLRPRHAGRATPRRPGLNTP